MKSFKVEEFLYLGTIFDQQLTFDAHCAKVIKTIQFSHATLKQATLDNDWLRQQPALVLFRLWHASVAVHALINLIILRRPTHLKSLQTALNTSFTSLLGLPRSAASYAYFEFGFPPLRLQCDLALARLFCRLTLSPPDTLHHRLFQLRHSYPAGPHKSSIESYIQIALIRLGRPLDFNAFNPPHVVAISRRPERAYAPFLRPALTRLWLADILSLLSLPLPWPSSIALVPPPPATRQQHYISLVASDLIRPNLFSPAHWLKTHPTLPFTLSLLRLRCQGSVLPTHTVLSPSNIYIPYDDR